MDKKLIEEAQNFVIEFFNEKYDSKLAYHSIEHTKEVAGSAEKIGKAVDLSSSELEAVILAAWFHDTGYLLQRNDHESASVTVAEEFLKKHQYPDSKIKIVSDCILATQMGYVPANTLQEVIRDADYSNLSSNDSLKRADLLRHEMENYGGASLTDEEWLTAELKFLLNHQYHTSYARNKLESKKDDNIKKIRKKLKSLRENEDIVLTEEVPDFSFTSEANALSQNHRGANFNANESEEVILNNAKINTVIMADPNKPIEDTSREVSEKEINQPVTNIEVQVEEAIKKSKKESEEKKPDDKKSDDKKKDEKKDEKKEVKKDEKKELEEKKEQEKREMQSVKEFDTIYKLIATNHMRLNEIADRKANIMLTLNGIILSITLSVVASSSESNLRLIIPTSIIIVSSLITIILAALSTRPKVTSGSVSKEDVADKKANLLFFGNFSKMEFPDFDWGIRQVMKDQEYLHNSMIVDFYSLGKVLEVKYKLLRICYNSFMIGLIISVLSILVLVLMGY